MRRDTIDRVLKWLEPTRIPTVDLTGGAPEMIPDFRYLVEQLHSQGRAIIDRCMLTIMLEKGYEDMPEFLAKHRVRIIASMPCYGPENVNAQRGEGVFDASIKTLRILNNLGYGIEEALPLHLVYNPLGATLPPDQADLELVYKRELKKHFGIVFNRLFTITNMPIARFESYLKRRGELESYMQLVLEQFNPASVEGLMCRDTISVSYLGEVFDCDFNQMLEIPKPKMAGKKLWETQYEDWTGGSIATAAHCFGCTAGAGSSCQGTTVT